MKISYRTQAIDPDTGKKDTRDKSLLADEFLFVVSDAPKNAQFRWTIEAKGAGVVGIYDLVADGTGSLQVKRSKSAELVEKAFVAVQSASWDAKKGERAWFVEADGFRFTLEAVR